jgi:mycofactocin system glycosyltransferase
VLVGTGPDPLPDGFRIALDPAARLRLQSDGAAVLIGGSPIRVLRLTSSGRRLVERLAAGGPVPPASGSQRLVRRLLDGGLAQPRPLASSAAPASAVTTVIPVRDDPAGLAATLEALGPGCRALVVDDASGKPGPVAAACRLPETKLLRQKTWGGPAAARNAGWRASHDEFVAFLDANCVPQSGWLDIVLPHFSDPQVAAVAPRIISIAPSATPTKLAAYDQVRSPLDLGPHEATVRPRSPVAYVPTAALVVRRRALEGIGGFDEGLRVGEDVDLVWRLAHRGWTIRYEPRAQVAHPTRSQWATWLRQRYAYGTSAAPLARRHGLAVAPASMSAWSAAAWLLVVLGRPLAAVAVAGGSTAALTRRLRGVRRDAVRLAGAGHLRAGLTAAQAVTRAWPPLAGVIWATHRRSRPAVAAAVIAPPLLEWAQRKPALDPLTYLAMRLADDMAYAAGVWAGCLRERSGRALMPDLTHSADEVVDPH